MCNTLRLIKNCRHSQPPKGRDRDVEIHITHALKKLVDNDEKYKKVSDQIMSNETIKKYEITVKLRGDNVYDMYVNGDWVVSRGNCDSLLEEAKRYIKDDLLEEKSNAIEGECQ